MCRKNPIGLSCPRARSLAAEMHAGFGAFATFVVFAWRDHDEYEISAEEVARLDRANIVARRGLVTAAGGA